MADDSGGNNQFRIPYLGDGSINVRVRIKGNQVFMEPVFDGKEILNLPVINYIIQEKDGKVMLSRNINTAPPENVKITARPVDKATDTTRHQRTVDSMGHQRTVDNMGHQRTVDSMGHQRTVDNMGHARTVDNMGHAMTVDNMGHQRTVDSMGHQRTVDSMGHQRTVDSMGHQRMVDSMGHQRTVDNMGHQRTVDNSGHARTVEPLDDPKILTQRILGEEMAKVRGHPGETVPTHAQAGSAVGHPTGGHSDERHYWPETHGTRDVIGHIGVHSGERQPWHDSHVGARDMHGHTVPHSADRHAPIEMHAGSRDMHGHSTGHSDERHPCPHTHGGSRDMHGHTTAHHDETHATKTHAGSMHMHGPTNAHCDDKNIHDVDSRYLVDGTWYEDFTSVPATETILNWKMQHINKGVLDLLQNKPDSHNKTTGSQAMKIPATGHVSHPTLPTEDRDGDLVRKSKTMNAVSLNTNEFKPVTGVDNDGVHENNWLTDFNSIPATEQILQWKMEQLGNGVLDLLKHELININHGHGSSGSTKVEPSVVKDARIAKLPTKEDKGILTRPDVAHASVSGIRNVDHSVQTDEQQWPRCADNVTHQTTLIQHIQHDGLHHAQPTHHDHDTRQTQAQPQKTHHDHDNRQTHTQPTHNDHDNRQTHTQPTDNDHDNRQIHTQPTHHGHDNRQTHTQETHNDHNRQTQAQPQKKHHDHDIKQTHPQPHGHETVRAGAAGSSPTNVHTVAPPPSFTSKESRSKDQRTNDQEKCKESALEKHVEMVLTRDRNPFYISNEALPKADWWKDPRESSDKPLDLMLKFFPSTSTFAKATYSSSDIMIPHAACMSESSLNKHNSMAIAEDKVKVKDEIVRKSAKKTDSDAHTRKH